MSKRHCFVAKDVMFFLRKKRLFEIFLYIVITFLTNGTEDVYAYGWTRPKGELYLSNFFTPYTIQEAGYDRANNGLQILLFTEYGLNDKVTIGTKTSFVTAYLPIGSHTQSSVGLDYVDLYINYQIYKNDKIGFTIGPVVKTPGKYKGDYGGSGADMFWCQNFWQPGFRAGFGWKITEKDIFMFRFDWFMYFIGHDHAKRSGGGVYHADTQLRFNIDYLHIFNDKWILWLYLMTFTNAVYNTRIISNLDYRGTFDYLMKNNIVCPGIGVIYNIRKNLSFMTSIWSHVKTPLLLTKNNIVIYGFVFGVEYRFNVFN